MKLSITITDPYQMRDIQSIFQDYYLSQVGNKFTFLLGGVEVTFEYNDKAIEEYARAKWDECYEETISNINWPYQETTKPEFKP